MSKIRRVKKPLSKKKTKSSPSLQELSAYTIIQKKRDGKKLETHEIKWFIDSLVTGHVADYQMSALLMAIYLKGMSSEETAALTDAMLYSGEVLHFNDKKVVDKHSTGGVGDKASFILAPIAAACGVKVPMIAGRGLGHTGGTIDKVEAIKGFKTSLDLEEFASRVKEKGLVLIGQTDKIAPADKKIYALRDVTATIESIPLITASIMSKKLAEGAASIVMDIKTGNGAFMSTPKQAKALAQSLRNTASRFKRPMITYITDMSQPLGQCIGHGLEIIESIETLKGKGPQDLTHLSLELAAAMVFLAGLAPNQKAAYKKCQEVLDNKKALEKLRDLIAWQGGDSRVIDDYSAIEIAPNVTVVRAKQAGYICDIQNQQLGMVCVALGGGRLKQTDKVDLAVGMKILKKKGDKVQKGTPLLEIYHHPHQELLAQELSLQINSTIIKIKSKKTLSPKLIIERKKNGK